MSIINGSKNKNGDHYLHVEIVRDVWNNIFFFLLLLIMLVAACLTVYQVQETRNSVIKLNKEFSKQDSLDIEYMHLRLEQQTLAEHSRITDVAKDKLKMQIPSTEQEVVINMNKGNK